MSQLGLFDGSRLQMTDSIRLSVESLRAYADRHRHWAIAWSGGKDSTAVVTLVTWLIDSGRIPRPASLTVLYADTRMELLPLWTAGRSIRAELEERGIDARAVMAPLDERFLLYILGRGVPPPNNNTMRWCTSQIKIEPMAVALEDLAAAKQIGADEKLLVLTGVRVGESAARDQRIALSCSRDGSECGQGWYQSALPASLNATLAPILHWRVCHVWEWLKHWAPQAEYGDWSTELLAEAYGGDEAEEINARTGCVGCPLASRDTALDTMVARPAWAYLEPLKGLRRIYEEMREPRHRLRKPGGERRKDGTLVKNQHRMGPLKLESRLEFLDRIVAIQADINAQAFREGRPEIDILNLEEEARIRELIAAETWPNKWSGDEPGAERPFVEAGQELLFGLEESEP